MTKSDFELSELKSKVKYLTENISCVLDIVIHKTFENEQPNIERFKFDYDVCQSLLNICDDYIHQLQDAVKGQ